MHLLYICRGHLINVGDYLIDVGLPHRCRELPHRCGGHLMDVGGHLTDVGGYLIDVGVTS